VSACASFSEDFEEGRVILYVSEVDERVKPFRFGEYMKIEDLMIQLHTRFAKTKDVEELTKFLADIKTTAEVVESDDGISQKVTTVVGAVSKREINAPLIVSLKPHRSFPEVNHVESKFMFRVKKEGSIAMACLFETDGGQWVNDTRDVIRAYLESEKPKTEGYSIYVL